MTRGRGLEGLQRGAGGPPPVEPRCPRPHALAAAFREGPCAPTSPANPELRPVPCGPPASVRVLSVPPHAPAPLRLLAPVATLPRESQPADAAPRMRPQRTPR